MSVCAWYCCRPLLYHHLMDSLKYVHKNILLAAKGGICMQKYITSRQRGHLHPLDPPLKLNLFAKSLDRWSPLNLQFCWHHFVSSNIVRVSWALLELSIPGLSTQRMWLQLWRDLFKWCEIMHSHIAFASFSRLWRRISNDCLVWQYILSRESSGVTKQAQITVKEMCFSNGTPPIHCWRWPSHYSETPQQRTPLGTKFCLL